MTTYSPAVSSAASALSPPVSGLAEVRHQLICQVAKYSLAQLAVSLALAGIACCFVATPAGMVTLFGMAIGAVVFYALVKAGAAYLQYRCCQLQKQGAKGSQEKIEELEEAIVLLQWIMPLGLGILDMITRNVLVHEAGHVIAGELLFQNPQPSVHLFPLIGGDTTLFSYALTPLGQCLGPAASQMILSAAGAIASVAFVVGCLIVAARIKNSYPEIYKGLLIICLMTIVQHVIYALSALWSPDVPGHDFVSCWQYGLHPIVAALLIIVIPLIVVLALSKKLF